MEKNKINFVKFLDRNVPLLFSNFQFLLGKYLFIYLCISADEPAQPMRPLWVPANYREYREYTYIKYRKRKKNSKIKIINYMTSLHPF